MLINEVCKVCKLTKKAVEYYCEQELISPIILKNGYRQFSMSDVEKLKKISTLRALGLSVAEISAVLGHNSMSTLNGIIEKKAIEIANLQTKQELMQQLANNQDWEDIREKLDVLQMKQSILVRLLDAFPGGYGKMLSIHFAAYLNEPIATTEQKNAYDVIVRFLDGIKIEIPDDLTDYLERITNAMDTVVLQKSQDSIDEAIANPAEFIKNNEDMLKQYKLFSESEEYKETPAYRLKELFKQILETNGYNDIFVPAMKQLSPSYKHYCSSLETANEIFLKNFSQS